MSSSEEEEYEGFSCSETEEDNESDFGSNFAAAVRSGATTDALTAMLVGVTTLDISGLSIPLSIIVALRIRVHLRYSHSLILAALCLCLFLFCLLTSLISWKSPILLSLAVDL